MIFTHSKAFSAMTFGVNMTGTKPHVMTKCHTSNFSNLNLLRFTMTFMTFDCAKLANKEIMGMCNVCVYKIEFDFIYIGGNKKRQMTCHSVTKCHTPAFTLTGKEVAYEP